MLAFACASDDSTSTKDGAPSDAAEPAATGTLTGRQGWPRAEGLRGVRYCEVLLARVVDARLNADVWNTYGLNDCPQEEWASLDAAAIKAEHAVLAAILNGPRYFLMDAIEKMPSERQETTFGALAMLLVATVDIGPIPPNLGPYIDRHVARSAAFEFSEGAEVYELVDPAGRVFVMQSYSQQNDTSLSEAQLAALGARLKLPAGWSYRSRVLDAVLRVEGDSTEATVTTDDLNNTYSLVE
jgi:hypothetical protein